jgi:hypothetical protein
VAQLPSKKNSSLRALERANDYLIALCVGVSEYPIETGLSPLKACSRDAKKIRDMMLDVPQLGVDHSRCRLLTAVTSDKPTRNTILGGLSALAAAASAGERILYFHSGHAVRIEDELYLVPSDAYASDEPDALIPLRRIKEILSKSPARQKLVILDACYSGPETQSYKSVPLAVSNSFVAKYVKETRGVALLSSSGHDQRSTVQSPDNDLSLFTHYLARALNGDTEALDENRHLTLFSLHSYLSARVKKRARSYGVQQQPVLDVATNADFLLGDFSGGLLEVEGVSLDQHPIQAIEFSASESESVKRILTRMKVGWKYTPEQLQYAANKALPEYLRDGLGTKAAALAEQLAISLSDIDVDGASISFPDGRYSVSYEAGDRYHGYLNYEAAFEGDWITAPDRIGTALSCLEMDSQDMTFITNGQLNLDRIRAGLPASGWKITSHLPGKIGASLGPYTLEATESSLTFGGLEPGELFGKDAEPEKAALVATVLGLLPARNK